MQLVFRSQHRRSYAWTAATYGSPAGAVSASDPTTEAMLRRLPPLNRVESSWNPTCILPSQNIIDNRSVALNFVIAENANSNR
eukprot:6191794-Pleurochrysis_carterae.AAC.3